MAEWFVEIARLVGANHPLTPTGLRWSGGVAGRVVAGSGRRSGEPPVSEIA